MVDAYRNDIVNATNKLVEKYINRPIALQIQAAVLDWLNSPIGILRLENQDQFTIIWELNAILTSISHDQHLGVKQSNLVSTKPNSNHGFGKTGPHYIEIKQFEHINKNENTRKVWTETFSKIHDYVVIDLQNCVGGSEETLQFMLSCFFETGLLLFTNCTAYRQDAKYSLSKLDLYPTYNQITKFNGTVYVYISGKSASAAEIAAKIFQSKNRAKLYGCQTKGSQYRTHPYSFGFIKIVISDAKCKIDDIVMEEGMVVHPDYDTSSIECVDFIQKIMTLSINEL